jgi:hypothetical protein
MTYGAVPLLQGLGVAFVRNGEKLIYKLTLQETCLSSCIRKGAAELSVMKGKHHVRLSKTLHNLPSIININTNSPLRTRGGDRNQLNFT